MTTEEGRATLSERREVLRRLYARFREAGSWMHQKGLVQWSREKHGYYAEFLLDRNHKERMAIQSLSKLQAIIAQQAMLLLELEHALDCDETKQKELRDHKRTI